jgi:predicted negative regulator of RcsB-dependent stress response
MAYDLEEQESLDALKDWWRRHGHWVTSLVTAGLFAYAGWTGWQYWQRTQAAEAVVLHETLEAAKEVQDIAKVQRVADDLRTRYSGTVYADLGAFHAAQVLMDSGNRQGARAQFQAIIDGKGRDEVKALARIRLATVLIDEKAFDEALKVLSAEMPPAMAALVAERRGDVFFAQQKRDEAEKAYQQALDKLSEDDNAARQFLQFKRDAVMSGA